MEDQSPLVRIIRQEELPELLDLYKHLHEDDVTISDEEIKSIWNEIYKDPNMNVLVVEVEGLMVATCVLAVIRHLTRGGKPYGIIENVVTQSNHRKKGYGRVLLTEALSLAWEKNCYKVMLLTGRKDEETLRFYEKSGFIPGVKTGYIAYPPK